MKKLKALVNFTIGKKEYKAGDILKINNEEVKQSLISQKVIKEFESVGIKSFDEVEKNKGGENKRNEPEPQPEINTEIEDQFQSRTRS